MRKRINLDALVIRNGWQNSRWQKDGTINPDCPLAVFRKEHNLGDYNTWPKKMKMAFKLIYE